MITSLLQMILMTQNQTNIMNENVLMINNALAIEIQH